MRPDGTLTPGNTSAMHDGAAMASSSRRRSGKNLAGRKHFDSSAARRRVSPENDAVAPIEAMKKLYSGSKVSIPGHWHRRAIGDFSGTGAGIFHVPRAERRHSQSRRGRRSAGPAVWRVGSAAGGPVVLAHGAAEGRQRPPARSGDAGCARRYGIGRIIRGRVAVRPTKRPQVGQLRSTLKKNNPFQIGRGTVPGFR